MFAPEYREWRKSQVACARPHNDKQQDHEAVIESTYLADLGMAVAEVELLDAVVYLLLTDHRQRLSVGRVQAAVHERRIIVVKPEISNNSYDIA